MSNSGQPLFRGAKRRDRYARSRLCSTFEQRRGVYFMRTSFCIPAARAGRLVLWAWLTAAAWPATFGTVVPIGGHASDIALDEARGVLYIANFTANRVEVMSTADRMIRTSINVSPQPGSLALSPDGQFLVIAHFGNFQTPSAPNNVLTVINLNGNSRQTFALANPPLGVAFGSDDKALIVTTTDFLLFDPASGAVQILDTVAGVTAKTLPVSSPNFPPQIVAASVAASGDGLRIYGVTDTILFSYNVQTKQVAPISYTAVPPLGPRVVSVSRDGSYYAAGWALFDARRGFIFQQFPNASGALNIGSVAINSSAGVIYAQVPEGSPQTTTPAPTTPGTPGTPSTPTTPSTPGTPTVPTIPPATPSPAAPQPPVLTVVDADNLTVRDRLSLPENMAGKSVLSSAGDILYSISDSGVLVLPVGSLNRARRLAVSQEDVVFRGNFCDRRVATQEISIIDPSGGNTDFKLTASIPGINISPASGMTPATVRISADPNIFQTQRGTVSASVQIKSTAAVNLPADIRILINNREPDQRGTFVNVPGKLVDILADPGRDRFYILRQDKNQLLVFDGTSNSQIATLRTGNTPTQMAITFDRRYLLVGHENSQFAYVYDLETLAPAVPIAFPGGHYPRSIASSGNAILAASRVAGPVHTIDRIDMVTRSASTLPSLGVFQNSIPLNTVLVASPNGSSILAAMPDGGVMLYSASADTFTLSRKDFTSLSGTYAASNFDQFVVDNNLLNASLVPTKKLESASGASSGFAFVDQFGFRTTSPSSSGSGVIQRVDLIRGEGIRPTRLAESPLMSAPGAVFTRTLAPLYSRTAILSLTTSGFTVLPWNYDASVAPPRLERIVNAADMTEPVAPGGLITVFGSQLSPVNIATRELPLPTALGESCLTVNGVPVPMIFASPAQINAQLPFNVDGNATLVLRTPGGVSDNYNLTILPNAPSVFRSGVAGTETGIPTVVRAKNNELATLSNPIHHGDEIIIFATGLGRTSPAIDAGIPASADPLPTTLLQPDVDIAGVSLPIAYAGLAPGQVGVYQINALVPRWVPLGISVPLTIKQGGSSTVLPVRVVD